MAAEAPQSDRPPSRDDACALIDRLGPFEASPHVAVAVSGGADSLALCLLTQDWARARGGRVTALTVDHGLRPEAAAEARQIGRWLAKRKIAHVTLRWRTAAGGRQANLQARAREARYRLMRDWCRSHEVLHLLTGHQREDQAETVLMRLGRGSGVDGLAAIPPVRESADGRTLRPLLSVPRARLAATLAERGQPWIEDPSNVDVRHARVRIRNALPHLAPLGLTVDRLAETADRMARARNALDVATAEVLVRAAAVHPAGFAVVDCRVLAADPPELGMRGLARLLMTVAGAVYPPRLERLERLYRELLSDDSPTGRTLGGCRLVPLVRARDAGRWLVCREPAAAAPDLRLPADGEVCWDGRFRVTRARRGRPMWIGKLGRVSGPSLPAAARARLADLPGAVRSTLPALRDARGIVAVPHIGFLRAATRPATLPRVRFAPAQPLT